MNIENIQQDGYKAHTTLRTLTVREVKVMHMPPKPLKVRAMKIRTESSANDTDVSSRVLTTTKLLCIVSNIEDSSGGLTIWFVGSVSNE